MVYASELPTSLESSFEWSDAVNVTDGGTYKILNSVFGEIPAEQSAFRNDDADSNYEQLKAAHSSIDERQQGWTNS